MRDISNGLRSATCNLNHLGIRRARLVFIFSYTIFVIRVT